MLDYFNRFIVLSECFVSQFDASISAIEIKIPTENEWHIINYSLIIITTCPIFALEFNMRVCSIWDVSSKNITW